ncbi:glycoside hydrolase family 36 protein [Backusella circina FSU 941]|nr:glycoside hydrolase family 36 protein [Backusella circina FSU 941]
MSQFVFSPNVKCQIVWKKGKMLDFYARPSLEYSAPDAATIELWSNLTLSKEWKGFRFTKNNDDEYRLTINTKALACDEYEFTMRYRRCHQDAWIWYGEPNQNGHIRLVPTQDIYTQPNIPTFASVPQLCFVNREQSTITDLWHFRTQAKNKTFSLGKINLPIQHYVASIHKSAHWLTPVAGSFGFHRNDDEKWQLFMYQDSLYGHIHLWMAVGTSACWFSPRDNHSLQFHHTPEDTDHLLIVTTKRRDFSSLMKTALHYASTTIFKSDPFPELLNNPVVLSEKLGYCTWNAFGTEDLCLDHLLLALESLQQSNIPIDYLLLDDGWQEIENYMLSSFDAIESKFPGGLKHSVEVLKRKYPNLKYIGVWHALWGYWKGIDEAFADANQYGPLVAKQGDASSVGLVEEVEKFYFDFYKFLQDSGINFTKVDSQGSFQNLTLLPIKKRLALWDRYRRAMIDSSDEFLSSRIIHCMSFTPHVLFQPILSTKAKAIFRNSDDFFPNEKDSHSWHIYANAINSLWTHHYPAIPDWDMFQTDHPFAEYHASSRAISGGSVYITDYPGKHNTSIVQKLIAETRYDGYSLLRSYQSSHPTFDTVFENPMGNHALLGLCNIHYEQCSEHSFSKPEYGVCGFWNTVNEEHLGLVETSMFHTKKLSMVPTVAYVVTGLDRGKLLYLGLENGSGDNSSDDETDYAISPYCLPSVNPKRTNSKLSVRVGAFGSSLVSVSPVRSLGAISASCLGLIDKYNSTRAILKTRLVEVNRGLCDLFEAELSHRSASCGFWIASNVWSCCSYKVTPTKAFVDDMELKTSDWSWSPETGLLVVNMMHTPLNAVDNDYFTVKIHITSINNV